MKALLVVLAGLCPLLVLPAHAHREDEYLQATFIAIEREQLRVDVFLTPGIGVLPEVFAELDADGDGALSESEKRRYAARVLADLSFALGGSALAAEVKDFEFPTLEQLRAGRGDIHLFIVVRLREPRAAETVLSFSNRHLSRIAAYHVNCLAPRDRAIRIGGPQRDPQQATMTVSVAIAP